MPTTNLANASLPLDTTQHSNTVLSTAQEILSASGFTDQRGEIYAKNQAQQNIYFKFRFAIEEFEKNPTPLNQLRLREILDAEISRLQKEYDGIKSKEIKFRQTGENNSVWQPTSSSYFVRWRNWLMSGIKQFFGSDNDSQADRYAAFAEKRIKQIKKLKSYRNKINAYNNTNKGNHFESMSRQGSIGRKLLSVGNEFILVSGVTGSASGWFDMDAYSNNEVITLTYSGGDSGNVGCGKILCSASIDNNGSLFSASSILGNHLGAIDSFSVIAALNGTESAAAWMTIFAPTGNTYEIYAHTSNSGSFLVFPNAGGNQLPTGHQFPAIAKLSTGGFVVVGTSGQTNSYGRCFDRAGNPTTDRILIGPAAGYQSVAGFPSGGFISVRLGSGINIRKFNNVGVSTSSETQVSTPGYHIISGYPISDSVAVLENEAYVVSWEGSRINDSTRSPYIRCYDNLNNPLSDAIQIIFPASSPNGPRYPRVAAFPSSGFILTWGDMDSQETKCEGLYGQIFTNTCKPKGVIFRIVSQPTIHACLEGHNAVAAYSDTRFLVAWIEADLKGKIFNPPKLVSSYGNSNSYTEKASPVIVDGNVVITEVVNGELEGASIAITGNFTSGDLLAFTSQAGITGNYNSTSGTATFSGTAPFSSYQNLLRSFTFSVVSNNPTTATRQITMTVDDGSIGSNFLTHDVNVIAVNDPPVLVSNNLIVDQGQSVVITPAMLSAYDPDSLLASITFTASTVFNGHFELITNPGVAIFSFTQQNINDSKVRFVHSGSQNSPSYLISVSDGQFSTSPAAATVNFTPEPSTTTSTTTPAPIAPTSSPESPKLSQGGIIGVSVGGGIFAIVAIGAIGFFACRKYKRKGNSIQKVYEGNSREQRKSQSDLSMHEDIRLFDIASQDEHKIPDEENSVYSRSSSTFDSDDPESIAHELRSQINKYGNFDLNIESNDFIEIRWKPEVDANCAQALVETLKELFQPQYFSVVGSNIKLQWEGLTNVQVRKFTKTYLTKHNDILLNAVANFDQQVLIELQQLKQTLDDKLALLEKTKSQLTKEQHSIFEQLLSERKEKNERENNLKKFLSNPPLRTFYLTIQAKLNEMYLKKILEMHNNKKDKSAIFISLLGEQIPLPFFSLVISFFSLAIRRSSQGQAKIKHDQWQGVSVSVSGFDRISEEIAFQLTQQFQDDLCLLVDKADKKFSAGAQECAEAAVIRMIHRISKSANNDPLQNDPIKILMSAVCQRTHESQTQWQLYYLSDNAHVHDLRYKTVADLFSRYPTCNLAAKPRFGYP